MQTFLETLIRTAEPEELLDGLILKRAVRQLQDQYIAHALYDWGPNLEKSSHDIQTRRLLRDTALYLEMALLRSPISEGDGGAEDLTQSGLPLRGDWDRELLGAVEVAATVLEFLSRTTASEEIVKWVKKDGIAACLLSGPLNDLLRSGLLYALADKLANGAVILERLARTLSELGQIAPEDQIHDFTLATQTITLLGSLIGGRAHDLDRAIGSGFRIEALASQAAGNPTDLRAVFTHIARACIDMIRGSLAPSSQSVASHQEEIQAALKAARHSRDPGLLWLVSSVERLLKKLEVASVRVALSQAPLPSRYLELLVDSGIPRLWLSQIATLRKGILEPKNDFAVGIPTGAGKSLLAELAIVSKISHRPGSWCIYLAPTRALVRQVERDLRTRLPKMGIAVRNVVAGAERGATIDEEMKEIAQANTVTVLTPEKLDVYLRFSPSTFANCSLCILDEAHLLGQKERGMRLEVLLSVLRSKNPDLKMVLFSAVISNVKDLAEWLGKPENYVDDAWRPTRQLKGLLVRHRQPLVSARVHQVKIRGRWQDVSKVGAKQPESRQFHTELFELGLILARELSDVEGINQDYLSFPGLVLAERSRERRRMGRGLGKWQETDPTTTAPELATALAQLLYRLSESQLLFYSTPESAEKAARDMAEFVRSLDVSANPELRRLADSLAAILGPRDALVDCVRAGVAYHHGQLPTVVKRQIEVAAKKGIVKIVCATSGLQEGLNVPAGVVIVAGGRYYSEEEGSRVGISAASFENVAGRAGRAFVGTEGLVIFVPEDFHEASLTYKQARGYMLVDSKALQVRSLLREILREFWHRDTFKDDEALLSLSPASQVVLLALYAGGLVGETEIEEFISRSFGGYSLSDSAKLRLSKTISGAVHQGRKVFGEKLFTLFSQTGLSIRACLDMHTVLHRLFGGREYVSLRSNGEIDDDVLVRLLSAISHVEELWSKIRWRDMPIPLHAHLVKGWLTQVNLEKEIEYLNNTGYFRSTQKAGDLQKYYAGIDSVLSWGFGVAFLLLDHLFGEALDQELSSLPLYAKYGVDSMSAAFLSLLGVSDRTAARALGELYDERTMHIGLHRIERWLSELTVDDVQNALRDQPIRQEVLADDLRLDWTAAPLTRLRMTATLRHVPRSSYLRIRGTRHGAILLDMDNTEVASIPPSDELWALLQYPCIALVL